MNIAFQSYFGENFDMKRDLIDQMFENQVLLDKQTAIEKL